MTSLEDSNFLLTVQSAINQENEDLSSLALKEVQIENALINSTEKMETLQVSKQLKMLVKKE